MLDALEVADESAEDDERGVRATDVKVPVVPPPSSAVAPSAVGPTPAKLPRQAPRDESLDPRAGAASQGRPATPPRVRSLAAELGALRRAQAALRRGDGQAALRELETYEHPDSRLAAERRAVKILALCATGRVSEAKRLAARFSSTYPNSLHTRAIANSCVKSDTD